MAELSEFGTIFVGALGGIADALQPDPTAPVPATQVRPDVQVGVGIPTEYLVLGGLGLVAVVLVVLMSR